MVAICLASLVSLGLEALNGDGAHQFFMRRVHKEYNNACQYEGSGKGNFGRKWRHISGPRPCRHWTSTRLLEVCSFGDGPPSPFHNVEQREFSMGEFRLLGSSAAPRPLDSLNFVNGG